VYLNNNGTRNTTIVSAFCDTFDQPMGTGNRSGDLNGDVWGVSRTTSGSGYGITSNPADHWYTSQQLQCDGTLPVLPEHDITVCNGMLIQSVNDGGTINTLQGNGNFTVLAMYPKQPFDIAGRTGTVVFDVGADSEDAHAAWPGFIYTDQPVPAPYEDAAGQAPFARNSFGFTIGRVDNTNCQYVADIYVTRNYRLFASFDNNLDFSFTRTGCVAPPTSFGQLNHFEVRISVSHIEVWGTDAGTTTFRQLLVANNPNLPLTRGVIWMEDIHYNACKEFLHQCDHTFAWDNVGFDGPILPRDWAVDVNDRLAPLSGGTVDLGWELAANGTTPALSLPNITADKIANAQPFGALLTLNFAPQNPTTITYRLNGNAAHSQPWVFADNTGFVWRTIAIPVSLSEVVVGNNSVTIQSSGPAAIANVDLILIGGGGIPTCINPSRPCGPTTSTATSTPGGPPSATPTSSLTSTRTLTPTRTRTPTRTLTPSITPTATPYPRPNVEVQVAPSGGTLQTTITARDAGCAQGNNQLQSLLITKLTNATLDVATSPITIVLTTPTTVSLPAHPASIGLTVRRITPGLAATVELTASDGCGSWPTFIGGGPSAF
jgi:hypothetical protein